MDLIPYIQRMIQQGGTALVPSGRGLQRTYGEFSELPYGIGGPSQRPGLGYIHNGEVQPPPRETFGKPATRMGPLIEGELASAPASLAARAGTALAASRGSMAAMANPLLAAIMGSLQPDLLKNHNGYFNSPNVQVASRFGAMAPPSAQPTPAQGPAIPGGQVTGSPLPDVPQAPTFAERFGNMDPAALAKGDRLPMSPNQYVAQNFPQTMAQAPAYAPPDPNRGNMTVPVPQPRPAAAPQAPAPQPEMGFFQRNAAMMRDPVTGMFIDPSGAARAQQQDQGGLIQRMLGYLGNKANT